MKTIDEKIEQGLVKTNLEQHVFIERGVQNLEYGTLVMTLRVHAGRVEDITTQEFKRVKFDKNKQTVLEFRKIVERPTE